MTPEEIAAANQFTSYMKGWATGAKFGAMDPKFTGHTDHGIVEAYERGYRAGQIDRTKAVRKATKIYGHAPSILRGDAT